jgi:hypothetical protein
MSTITCPHCKTETSSEYNFCTTCDRQVKCLQLDCNKVLVAGKTFCFGCGKPLAAIATQAQPNRYIRDVKQRGQNYEEHTEFSVSDHAVSELAPFIAGQMTSRPPQRPFYPTKAQNSVTTQQNQDAVQNALGQSDLPQLPPADDETQQEDNNGYKSEAMRYFVKDGETLVAKHKDYKGTTWAEQQRRFILLLAKAYIDAFNKPIPSKDVFKSAAETASVYDKANFSRYFDKCCRKELTAVTDGLMLTTDGEKEVDKIISEIENDSKGEGHKYWERSQNTLSKRQRLNKADSDRIKLWAGEEIALGSLDIRNINTPSHYALLALWILTAHLKKVETVRWIDAYYYLKEKYPTITASSLAFSRAMANDANSKYIRASEDDKFFLTPEGQTLVESWINGSASPSSKTKDK